MKCWVMKHIWYLPTWGQECTVMELQPILFEKFDLGHPVTKIMQQLTFNELHKLEL